MEFGRIRNKKKAGLFVVISAFIHQTDLCVSVHHKYDQRQHDLTVPCKLEGFCSFSLPNQLLLAQPKCCLKPIHGRCFLLSLPSPPSVVPAVVPAVSPLFPKQRWTTPTLSVLATHATLSLCCFLPVSLSL